VRFGRATYNAESAVNVLVDGNFPPPCSHNQVELINSNPGSVWERI